MEGDITPVLIQAVVYDVVSNYFELPFNFFVRIPISGKDGSSSVKLATDGGYPFSTTLRTYAVNLNYPPAVVNDADEMTQPLRIMGAVVRSLTRFMYKVRDDQQLSIRFEPIGTSDYPIRVVLDDEGLVDMEAFGVNPDDDLMGVVQSFTPLRREEESGESGPDEPENGNEGDMLELLKGAKATGAKIGALPPAKPIRPVFRFGEDGSVVADKVGVDAEGVEGERTPPLEEASPAVGTDTDGAIPASSSSKSGASSSSSSSEAVKTSFFSDQLGEDEEEVPNTLLTTARVGRQSVPVSGFVRVQSDKTVLSQKQVLDMNREIIDAFNSSNIDKVRALYARLAAGRPDLKPGDEISYLAHLRALNELALSKSSVLIEVNDPACTIEQKKLCVWWFEEYSRTLLYQSPIPLKTFASLLRDLEMKRLAVPQTAAVLQFELYVERSITRVPRFYQEVSNATRISQLHTLARGLTDKVVF